jgi:hypothetical protein
MATLLPRTVTTASQPNTSPFCGCCALHTTEPTGVPTGECVCDTVVAATGVATGAPTVTTGVLMVTQDLGRCEMVARRSCSGVLGPVQEEPLTYALGSLHALPAF